MAKDKVNCSFCDDGKRLEEIDVQIAASVAAECERCAKICDEIAKRYSGLMRGGVKEAAAAIRQEHRS